MTGLSSDPSGLSSDPQGRVSKPDSGLSSPQGVSKSSSDADHLARAVTLATENVAAGGGPFGALIVAADGTVIGEGQNRVTRDLDPTAHAEVMAIRAACQTVGDFSLAGATLYTSCEPCPLCLSAALWSRLDRVVFTANRHDAAEGGFDDSAFYAMFEQPSSEWQHPSVDEVRTEDAVAPFDAWRANEARTDY